MTDLVPLPGQPDGVPWPTYDWPSGSGSGDRVHAVVGEMFADEARYGTTYSVVVVAGGEIVAERYGGEITHWDAPPEPVTVATKLLSWSMAKSILHAVVGILSDDGLVDLSAPVRVPEWAGPDDPRAAITLDDLLGMRDGLDFVEDYEDAGRSDVIEMLFGAGKDDVAHFAADRGLAAPPGTRFNYSSGTSNIVARIAGSALGAGNVDAFKRFLADRLFGPIGMGSATPTFDAAGTFVASSYLHATARDFARFGLLYLRDGVWDGRRVLPHGWVDHARTARSVDEDGALYGAHWWVVGDDVGSFRAAGYEGQSILVCPAFDLVAVRLGRSTAEQADALMAWRAGLVDAFR